MLEIYKIEKNLLREGSVEEMMRIIVKRKGVGETLEFGYNEYGKPFLDAYPEFHFNGSHSGEYVVCALCNNAVGIDIQKIDVDKDVMALSKRFMTPTETKNLQGMDEAYRKGAFIRLWAQKEAYMKYTGLGLALPLNSFSIKERRGTYKVVQNELAIEDISICPVRIEAGYEAWICGEFDMVHPEIITLTEADL